jgi:hypothetical protein
MGEGRAALGPATLPSLYCFCGLSPRLRSLCWRVLSDQLRRLQPPVCPAPRSRLDRWALVLFLLGMAYLDSRMVLFGGRVFALQASEMDSNHRPLGAVYAGEQALLPVPTQSILEDQLYMLQMRFGEIAEHWEGEVAPSMAPGLPPLAGRAGTRPKPTRAPTEAGRKTPRPSAAMRTKLLKTTPKAKVKKHAVGKPATPRTTTTQEADGRPAASLAIGARRRPPAEPAVGVQPAIGASAARPAAASSATPAGTPPNRRSPAKLPFAARTPVLRAHLGAKKYARIIGAGRLSASER